MPAEPTLITGMIRSSFALFRAAEGADFREQQGRFQIVMNLQGDVSLAVTENDVRGKLLFHQPITDREFKHLEQQFRRILKYSKMAKAGIRRAPQDTTADVIRYRKGNGFR